MSSNRGYQTTDILSEAEALINAVQPDPGALTARLMASYASILDAAANDVVFTPPWVKLNDAPIFSKGTINVIQGKAGVHKSRLAETFCSLLLSNDGRGDFLGFERHNLGPGYYVTYIDTERNSKEHFPAAVQRIRERAGLDKKTDNGRFHPVSIKQVERKQRLEAVKAWITHMRDFMGKKGVGDWNLFCVLDVVTDCTRSFNNEDETLALFDFLGDLCEKHSVCFLLIIHENPGSEKARGHAGTEALNKADAQMQIAYESGVSGEESDLIKIRFLKTRNAARPSPLYLQYSKDVNGLVTADPDKVAEHVEARKKNRDTDLLIEGLQRLFDASDEILGQALFNELAAVLKCSERTAERRAKELSAKGVTILDKRGRKCKLQTSGGNGKPTVYYLEPNNPDESTGDLADDDPPF